MERKLEQGRYVPSSGGLSRVTGAEEIAQRVMMKLTARRGGFAPLPEYGSALHTLLHTARPGAYETAAMQYIAQALADEPEVTVTAVEVRAADGETLGVDVHFTAAGQAFGTTLTV